VGGCQAIGAIRKAIDDGAAAQRLIQTVKRKGHRFAGAVNASGAPAQLSIAETLGRLNPELVFIYVSGLGTDSTEQDRVMWVRVKGRA
jgi:hypothetical protein